MWKVDIGEKDNRKKNIVPNYEFYIVMDFLKILLKIENN